jgi:hypothetical protein
MIDGGLVQNTDEQPDEVQQRPDEGEPCEAETGKLLSRPLLVKLSQTSNPQPAKDTTAWTRETHIARVELARSNTRQDKHNEGDEELSNAHVGDPHGLRRDMRAIQIVLAADGPEVFRVGDHWRLWWRHDIRGR